MSPTQLPQVLPSDSADAESLFRWESAAARVDCLTNPCAEMQESLSEMRPRHCFFSLSTIIVDTIPGSDTAAAVRAFIETIGVGGNSPEAHPALPAWCLGVMARVTSGVQPSVMLPRPKAQAVRSASASASDAGCNSATGVACPPTFSQNLIYGECGIEALHTLLCVVERHCSLSLDSRTFVDLGHGNGSVVMSAMLLRQWGAVLGVEFCAQRCAESKALFQRWRSEVRPQLARENKVSCGWL
jgi:hypothetical protein